MLGREVLKILEYDFFNSWSWEVYKKDLHALKKKKNELLFSIYFIHYL